MDERWLVRIYEESGLNPDDAQRAAERTLLRWVRRERRVTPRAGSLGSLRPRDPLSSLFRLIGRGDESLPLVDGETGQLSVPAIGQVLAEVGLDPVVGMAYAKVVAEAFEPKDFYQPLWEGLGRRGAVDLQLMRTLDWTPLRAAFPGVASSMPDGDATEQVPTLDAPSRGRRGEVLRGSAPEPGKPSRKP